MTPTPPPPLLVLHNHVEDLGRQIYPRYSRKSAVHKFVHIVSENVPNSSTYSIFFQSCLNRLWFLTPLCVSLWNMVIFHWMDQMFEWRKQNTREAIITSGKNLNIPVTQTFRVNPSGKTSQISDFIILLFLFNQW